MNSADAETAVQDLAGELALTVASAAANALSYGESAVELPRPGPGFTLPEPIRSAQRRFDNHLAQQNTWAASREITIWATQS